MALDIASSHSHTKTIFSHASQPSQNFMVKFVLFVKSEDLALSAFCVVRTRGPWDLCVMSLSVEGLGGLIKKR